MNKRNKLVELVENANSELFLVTEETVTSKKDLLDYADAIASKMFGDEKDDAIVADIVKNAIKNTKGKDGPNWAQATGWVKAAYFYNNK